MQSGHQVGRGDRASWSASGEQPRVVVGVADHSMAASVVGELVHEVVQRAGQVQWFDAQHDPGSLVVVDDLVASHSGHFGQLLSEQEQE